MKIYLSGPMTGLPYLNYPAFMVAAADLRARGFDVYNPAEWEAKYNDGEFNLTLICREAVAVVTLPGWENSPGATAETSLARALRKPVVSLDVALAVGPEGIPHKAGA